MTQRYSNNAICLLGATLSDSATSFVFETGFGDLYPEAGATSPSGDDWFKVVLTDATGEIEIIYVYTRASGSDLAADCIRGREGTAARAWASGAVIKLAPTAKDLENALQVIPSGSRMVFQQSTAPLGWTKDTTHNNKALRIVSGSVVNGGTVDFTAAFSAKTITGTVSVAGHALTIAQMPSHEHDLFQSRSGANTKIYTERSMYLNFGTITQATREWDDRLANANGEIKAAATGGGQAHTHGATFTGGGMDLAVRYVDFIICTKD